MNTPDIDGVKTLDPNAAFSIGETARLLGMTHNGTLGRVRKGLMKAGKTGSRYFVMGSEIQKQLVLPTEVHDV